GGGANFCADRYRSVPAEDGCEETGDGRRWRRWGSVPVAGKQGQATEAVAEAIHATDGRGEQSEYAAHHGAKHHRAAGRAATEREHVAIRRSARQTRTALEWSGLRRRHRLRLWRWCRFGQRRGFWSR